MTRWYVQDAVSKPLQEGKGGTLLLLLPLLESVSYESKNNGMSPQTPLYFHSIHCLSNTLFTVQCTYNGSKQMVVERLGNFVYLKSREPNNV